MITSRSHRALFYLLSFVEGGSVMAAEISGAKMLAPWFGSSLYVWSAVMAITLAGLAMGYYFGGLFSSRENKFQILNRVLLIAAVILLLMPFVSGFIIILVIKLSLMKAVVCSATLILLPPLFFMGMVSPLMVACLQKDASDGSKRTGEVFAISTLGGILSTFLTGFYLIPAWGLNAPVFCFGISLLFLTILLLLLRRKFYDSFMWLLLATFSAYISQYNSNKQKAGLLYASDGLLGRLEVFEFKDHFDYKGISRVLVINNIFQTVHDVEKDSSILDYINVIKKNLPNKQPGKALVLGLGGGSVANMLVKGGYQVTAVELDERIASVAKEYFNLDKSVRVIVDDARHALYNLNEKFDVVVFDLFHGEVPPSHIITKESLASLKRYLTEDFRILINSYGYIKDASGKGNHALLATLQSQGWDRRLCYAGQEDNEDYRNLILVAAENIEEEKLFCEIPIPTTNLYAEILTDKKPVLEFLNAEASKRWRANYIRNYTLVYNKN